MKTILLSIQLLILVTPVVGQQPVIKTLWASVRRLEARPTTYQRDTALVRAYADFVAELVKREPADSGLVYSGKALALAESRSWQPGILVSLLRKASCLNIANQHYEAIRVGLAGLALAGQQNNLYYRAVFHRSLGNNYDMLDNYDQAIPHYETCLRLTKGVPALLRTRANTLVELGDAYRFIRKRPDRAKALIEQAIAIYQVADSSSLGYGYDYYGQALTDLKLFREAEESFARSDHYLQQAGKEYLMPELLLHQAELYGVWKKYPAAITKARICLAYSIRKKSLYGQRGAYRVLYESNKAVGRLDSALIHHERFVMFNDSINETDNQGFRAVQAYYEQQKQTDAIISQLTIDRQRQTQRLLLGGLVLLLLFSGYVFYNNRRLRQKNRAISTAQLQGQTLERQRVAADLHDNLGTTLTALQWSLDATDKSKLTAAEQAVYATIREQVGQAYRDVRLLSHNLLPAELAKQGLGIALQNLVNKMNRNTAVRFRLSGVNVLPRLDERTEFELYSVCLELLNNTIKHAEATESAIDFSLGAGTLVMTVSDNGKGVAGQLADGRGLQNVAARVASLSGTLVIKSVPDSGVQYQVTVPVRIPARASWQI